MRFINFDIGLLVRKVLDARRAGGLLACLALVSLLGCAPADVPGSRNVNVPAPTTADERAAAVNERPDSVLYLPLGVDVLVPETRTTDPLPDTFVGPFELRSETLAGALQLIMADYEVPLAFETEEGLSRRITVANLKGPLNSVVRKICGLANLYCAYEDGLLVVKETQTFTVKIPPISQDANFMQNVASGLSAIIGSDPIIDESTRTIVYEATNRNADLAERYFQRMRSSTALIVFETYIWEVSLNSGNSTGIQWSYLDSFGKFTANIDLSGSVGSDFTNPISIGLPATGFEEGGEFSPMDIFRFLTQFGTVKTISQPQITVLSGSEARLRVADTENFVSEVSQTIDDGQTSTSVDTSSVDTGFTLNIASAWDNSTVYANMDIVLTDVTEIEDFPFSSGDETTTVQLPKTTERELQTQVRVRPGDSLLIAGLVRETDNFDSTGIGMMKPLLPQSRTAQTTNLELVFLLRPRVVVFASPSESEYYNTMKQQKRRAQQARKKAASEAEELIEDPDITFTYDFAPLVGQPGTKSGKSSGADAGGDPVNLQSTLSTHDLNPGAN